jgi:hypothetical protein
LVTSLWPGMLKSLPSKGASQMLAIKSLKQNGHES